MGKRERRRQTQSEGGTGIGDVMQASCPGMQHPWTKQTPALFDRYLHAWAHETSHILCKILSQHHPARYTLRAGHHPLHLHMYTPGEQLLLFQQRPRRHRSAAARLHGNGQQSPVSLLLHTNSSQDEVEVLFNSAAPCGLHRRYLGSSGCCHHLLPLPGDVGGGPQSVRSSAEQAPAGESHAVQTIWTSPVARVLSLWLAVLGEQLTVLW
jgi:hypothetical protein